MKSPHLDRDWLFARYITDGMSTYDIAKLVGRDPKRIYEKLVDFGIPTRPRGLNLKGDDNFSISNPGESFRGKKHTEATRKVLSEKASVPKPHLRGNRNGMYGRTGESNPHYVDGHSPERQRIYSSAAWKELLRQIHARDAGRCVRCLKKKRGKKAMCTHHIRSWKHHPDQRLVLENVVTLCTGCHNWIHSPANTLRVLLG